MNFRTTLLLLVLLAGALVFVFVARHHGASDQNTQTFDTKGKKLFDQKADNITKLVIRPADSSAKTFELDKTGGKWQLVQPINWPAEDFEARNLVESILDLRSQGGVELNDANLASTGLDHPRYTIEATDTGGKTITLHVGARSTLGNDLYVKVGDEKGGELVAGGSLADKLEKGTDKLADSLRDKQLVKASSSEMRQVEIEHKGQKLVLNKEGENWQIVEPRKAPGDSSEVSDLLFAITGLRADEFIDPAAPEAADAEFDKPKAVVWFSTAQPTTRPTSGPAATRPSGVTVTFGQFTSVDRDKLYVKLSDPNIVAKVPMTQTQLEKLTGASVLSLRDRKVVDVTPEHVERFTLAIDRAATTQPTTRPAEQHECAIVRRHETAAFGPTLGPAAPATQPTTGPATLPAVASTQPATQPAVAATQPGSKWAFESGGRGDADDGQVQDLLNALHPLRAEKFLENAPTSQPAATYTLTIHVGPANGHGPQDHTLRFTTPGATGNVIGSYEDLSFEVDRSILEKLDGDFRTKKPATSERGFQPG